MRALPHLWRLSTEEHLQAQQLLRQAIDLDANYAHAHALLGWSYISMFNLDTRGRSANSPTGRSKPATGR